MTSLRVIFTKHSTNHSNLRLEGGARARYTLGKEQHPHELQNVTFSLMHFYYLRKPHQNIH